MGHDRVAECVHRKLRNEHTKVRVWVRTSVSAIEGDDDEGG